MSANLHAVIAGVLIGTGLGLALFFGNYLLSAVFVFVGLIAAGRALQEN